jgi:peptidyl-tRNA hydrolase
VLGRPSASDGLLMREAIDAAADVVPLMINEGAQIAMNRLHSREGGPGSGAPAANT